MTTNLSNLIEYDIYATDISQLNDVSELCRLCLDKCDDMVSIYGVINVFNQETTSILDELQQFSSTELSKDPRYPSCICSNCLDLLKISSKIRLQMKFTQKELDKFFNNLQSDSKLECMEPEIKIEEKDDEKSLDGNQEKFPIEVISSTGSFKLDELLVEERIKDNLQSYDGFLNNLGSVISARYVNTDSTTKIQIEEPSVEIIKFINKDSPEKMSLKSFTKHKQKKSSNKTSRKKTSKIKSPKDETEKAVINNIINPENKSKNPTSLLCQICGFLATKKQQLRYHMHSKHTINERHHVCNICNKAFIWKHTLEQHKAVHNNERRFLCTVCGNNFNYLSALIYHMRTHTGEKRYRCDYCPKVFSMSWGLTRHLRVHTGAKPYNCEFCNKAFASTTEVKSHERTHTGEKPFQCHVCQKKFSKKDNMNVHFLTHDGPSKCSICSRGFMNPKILKLHHKFVHNQNVKKIKRENAKVMENEDVLEEEGNVAEKEYIRQEDEEEEVCEEESDEQVEIVEENVADFMNEGLG